MEIIPLNDYVLLEEIKPEVSSLIITPEEADLPRSNVCKIIYAGEKTGFVMGETVMILPHAFHEIENDGKKYLIGKSENIIARINQ